MTARGIKTESEAIRQAVEEGLARIPEPVLMNWAGLRGKGLGTSTPQFTNNDQLLGNCWLLNSECIDKYRYPNSS